MGTLMDFVLGIASSVLSNVLSELFTGKKDAAQKEEIERQVTQQLEPYVQKQREQIDEVRQLILAEINNIAKSLSGVIVVQEQIAIKKQNSVPKLWPKPKSEKTLNEQLEQLRKVIEARRAELQVSVEPSSELADQAVIEGTVITQDDEPSEVVWRPVRKLEESKPLRPELLAMEERIRRAREGFSLEQ